MNGYQYLQILAAETEGHVTSTITLNEGRTNSLIEDLQRIYHSDYNSAIVEAWNQIRTSILEAAVMKNLIPAAAAWMKNKLRELAETVVSTACTRHLDTVRFLIISRIRY